MTTDDQAKSQTGSEGARSGSPASKASESSRVVSAAPQSKSWSRVAAAIALGLLGLFVVISIYVLWHAGDPPLLADPAPIARPTVATNGAYPPQFRGAFDSNGRAVALLAIVGPLVTTVVAFFFGQRAGAAAGEAAEAKATAEKQAATSIVQAAADAGDEAAGVLVARMRQAGVRFHS